MDYSCGNCVHCADRHGDSFRTNDGVCLLIGVTVRKDDDSKGIRGCGMKLKHEEHRYVPRKFERGA